MKAIVSGYCRIRHPRHFFAGDDSIVDDFSYFSTKVKIGRCCHIASGCTIAGGIRRTFRIGDYSSVSSGAKIWCTSDDFARDVVTLIPQDAADRPEHVKKHLITGDVSMGRFTAVGANAVVMPGNDIPEGTVIGALSFVPAFSKLKPWSVYAGVPIRLVRKRDKANVLKQAAVIQNALRAGKKR